MAAGSSSGHSSPESASLDFRFGFNNVNFSDRILTIEILPEPDSDPDDSERKRRRVDPHSNAYCDEVAKDKDNEAGVEVRTLHINSLILAAESPFFHKLFSNGMRESQQRYVTLQIQASEEAAVMDMLKFMYSNPLPVTTVTALLNVVIAADKFEVPSCIRYCSHVLRTLPMTCELALLYLDLPPTVLMADTHLGDSAKCFLLDRFKHFTEYKEEVLNLPLVGLEAILCSDDLQVSSEDEVYDFVLKWARLHYPNPEERQEVLNKNILRFVRFPLMSYKNLRNVRSCSEIESEVVTEAVMEALLFKGEAPHEQRALVAKDFDSTLHQFVERPCRYRPLKVVENEKSFIALVDFKREECAELSPSGRICSQGFVLGGRRFALSGCCKTTTPKRFNSIMDSHMKNQRNWDRRMIKPNYDPRWNQCFEFSLGMDEPGEEEGLTVDYVFAVRLKYSEEFVRMAEKKNVLIGGQVRKGSHVLFAAPSTASLADGTPYFVDGVLHLKVEITIKK